MKEHVKTGDVTVGIPFYAGSNAEHLRLAVESILRQTLQPTVIHLIQDGPVPPDVEALVKCLRITYPDQIRHLRLEENSGLPVALNLSILEASTQYYARMDCDDIAHPERLERQVRFLDHNPGIDILGTWVIEFSSEQKPDEGTLKRLPSTAKEIERFFHYRDPFAHPSVMFRRTVFSRIGLYNPSFRTDQDTELWARALRARVGVANLPDALLFFRADGIVSKRSSIGSVIRQARARYSFNTWSIKYNALKLASLLFRILPYRFRQLGYERLR